MFVADLSAISLIVGALTLIVAGVGFFRIGVVPTGAEVVRLLLYLAVSVVYIGFWLALATLFSVMLRSAATSALAAIAAWLVSTLFALLLAGIVADVLSPLPASPRWRRPSAARGWSRTCGASSPAPSTRRRRSPS